jgi:hypothetical protein
MAFQKGGDTAGPSEGEGLGERRRGDAKRGEGTMKKQPGREEGVHLFFTALHLCCHELHADQRTCRQTAMIVSIMVHDGRELQRGQRIQQTTPEQ